MSTYIFIPGLISDARVWHDVAAAVDAPAITVTMTEDDSIPAMAERALGAADGPLVPVGHSMGGRVAMEMARRAPERMAGLVLADTGHHPLAPGERPRRLARIAEAHADMGRMVDDWLPGMVGAARHATPRMAALREMAVAAGPDVHERQIRALIGRPDALPGLAGLACPVLLLVGAEDRWSPRAQHDEIAAVLAAAEVVEIPDAGHFLPFENPVATRTAILAWAARHGL